MRKYQKVQARQALKKHFMGKILSCRHHVKTGNYEEAAKVIPELAKFLGKSEDAMWRDFGLDGKPEIVTEGEKSNVEQAG